MFRITVLVLSGVLVWPIPLLAADDQPTRGLSAADIEALRAHGEAEGWTFTVRESEATRRPLSELCGLVEPDDWRKDATFDPCTTTRDAPSAFNWCDLGACPPVRSQGGCGSCWAFGTVGPLECNILYKDGLEVDLSEQWLVSCNQSGWSCSGGWFAHNYHHSSTDPCGGTGAVLEANFPYVAYDKSCYCPYPHEDPIESWSYVGSSSGVPSVSALKQAIMDYGPVSVAVYVNSAFQGYGGGVFNGCVSGTVNHAVVLVGWDDEQGSDGVWFMRNSWGSSWGEGGYMRIPYGCSRIGYAACYVDYASRDCNANGIPDGCDLYCGPSGGACDVPGCGLADDCNNDHRPDDCDIGGLTEQDFGSADGPGYQLNGSATRTSDAISLTPAQGDQIGSMIFDRRSWWSVQSVAASFDFRIGGGSGADGFSFAVLDMTEHNQFELFGESGPEDSALAIEFDTYANAGEDDNHLELWFNGISLGRYYPTFDLNNDLWHHASFLLEEGSVTVVLTPDGGSPETVIDAEPIPGYTPFSTLFGFGARTGGDTDSHWIDNVTIDFTTVADCNYNSIHDECDATRVITGQSWDRTCCPGHETTFNVTVGLEDFDTFSYQWKKGSQVLSDGGNISGATSPTLTVTNTLVEDQGDYHCVVTADSCIDVASDLAELTIIVAEIVEDPETGYTWECQGGNRSYSVVAGNINPLLHEYLYQWFHDGEPLGPPAPGWDVLNLENVSLADVGDYTCQVTSACGGDTVESAPATLKVVSGHITQHPQSVCVEDGEPVEFMVDSELDYEPEPGEPFIFLYGLEKWEYVESQWQLHHYDEEPPLTIDPVQPDDAGRYRVYAYTTGPGCRFYSEEASLRVGTCPDCDPSGDMNGDGKVDLADLQVFTLCFGPGRGLVPGCECANLFFADDDVNLADWAEFSGLISGPK